MQWQGPHSRSWWLCRSGADDATEVGLYGWVPRRRVSAGRAFSAVFQAGEFLQHRPHEVLQLAEFLEILLKSAVELEGVLRRQLRPHDHVAQMHGVGQRRILVELFEGGLRIVVIHTPMMQRCGTGVNRGVESRQRYYGASRGDSSRELRVLPRPGRRPFTSRNRRRIQERP